MKKDFRKCRLRTGRAGAIETIRGAEYVRRFGIYSADSIRNQPCWGYSPVFSDERVTFQQKKNGAFIRCFLCGGSCVCLYLVCGGLAELCKNGGICDVFKFLRVCPFCEQRAYFSVSV